ncbi:UDP-glucose 4-epimerase family protein [Motilimonas pumila]|uniref:SDR family oxidoreductase n=1 Tax=Motilimonas pumila TaxID=2303987 RepID=A0A418YIZ2_9GAMM|nr:SDR family oxidoreductase [Motilimonas pumila]RJG50616.1 SDR family oxidoreductase [Motilimonas pumila]
MILITGATGFIGNHLIKALEGHSLSLLSRRKTAVCSNHLFTQAEINGSTDFTAALRGCNTVIHCAGRAHIMTDEASDPLSAYREVNTYGTLNLANQAVLEGVKRFIFISSIKVNGETSSLGKPFTYNSPHDYQDDYGQSKSEAETGLIKIAASTGLELVIIRPTLVYGPGVKANFLALMNLIKKGYPLPFKCINNNKRSLISVKNLVDLIITCIDHPNAPGNIFLASDGEDKSTSEIAYEMALALNKKPWQIPVPQGAFRFIGKLTNKEVIINRLLGSLQVDIQHTQETLNWNPPQKLRDAFIETLQSNKKLKD